MTTMENAVIFNEKMTAICDAIREKTDNTEILSLDMMASEIAGISTGVELNFDVVGGVAYPSGNKNLISYPYTNGSGTANGFTNTVNEDGSITCIGTATATLFFGLRNKTNQDCIVLKPGTYTLSGCPSGGKPSSTIKWKLTLRPVSGSGDINDFGDTTTFTLEEETAYNVFFAIYTSAGEVNLTFKPQLEKGSVATSFIKAEPKENTIWIKTDIPVNGWRFSVTEPENPVEGMVWIKTSTYSDPSVELNALKENYIQLYPNSCVQYIDGTWVDKDPQTYRNGKWTDWTLYVYDNGVINEEIAGTVAMNDSNNKFTLNASSIHINSTGTNAWGTVYFTKPVDLTNYKTLYMVGSVTITGSGEYWGALQFGAIQTLGGIPVAKIEGAKAQGTHSVDISTLSGPYYIGVRLKGFANYAVADISQIYLKR